MAAASDGAGPAAFVTSVSGTGRASAVRAMAPGVRVGAWPALLVLGAIVTVVVQTLLADRRIPTQLFESAGALLIGLTAYASVWAGPPPVAVSCSSARSPPTTLLRQLLFPLRDLARHMSQGRSATAVSSALVPRWR